MKRSWWILLLFMSFSLHSIGVKQAFIPGSDGIIHELEKNAWIDSVSASLSIDQKIAQFFMVGAYPTQGESSRLEVEKLIKTYNIGGVIFFKGHPTEIATWSNSFQQNTSIPLFVSIDGEWGVNMRVDSTIQYPRQLTLGAIQDDELIYQMGERIALECKALGINVNLAPVLDINNNINNPVINDRSFGEDKYNVALKGLAYAQGMQNQGVMAVGKHFPGHGDTDTDSHQDLPVIKHNFARLDSLELYPFKVAIENGMMGIMVAHLNIPALDKTPNLASSLSKKVVSTLLKDSLGFKGLVFSDALNMQGASKYFGAGEVDKLAFIAGNDVLVIPSNIPKAIAAIKQAINTGEISEAYLDERLKKVLEYKYYLGLNKKTYVSTKNLNDFLLNKEAIEFNNTLFEKALTLVNNEQNLIPLNPNQADKIAVLSLGKGSKQALHTSCENLGIKNHFFIGNDMQSSQISAQISKLASYEKVVVGLYDMSRWKSKNFGITSAELEFLKKLNQEKELILILFGSPYSLSYFQDFKTILVAYEENIASQKAAGLAIFGAITVNGKLPVSAGRFKVNTGIELSNKDVLKYALPSEVQLDAKRLDSIDYFAKKAIELEATPGCQILVAKDGKIIYNKSFGNSTYEESDPITNSSIYDLASITKVAATTLAVMKLYEENKIDLNKDLKTYLPQLKETTVGGLVIKEILAHQSGLPAWIPFYAPTVEDSVYNNWYSVDSNASYCVKVADDLFICKDSSEVIWTTISGVKIKEKPEYKYSDLGFYLLMQLVEKLASKSLDQYVEENFYSPMGLHNIAFLPRNKFDLNRIVPTERDTIFRKQEIKGYVHDPGAAMLGGVCGHAGLFSNSQDLAAIFQMLLNKGFYNGKQLLKAETIEYFNTQHYSEKDNRRALGFDKPVIRDKNGAIKGGPTCSEVSDACFGHTGFTGTCVWADPEYNLVYVFLSNRTYPYANENTLAKENIRTDIQGVIYRSILH